MDDASADSASPVRCRAGELFCDDFEGPSLVPPWDRQSFSPTGSIGHDTTTVHDGATALVAAMPTAGGNSYVGVDIDDVRAAGAVYMRSWFWFPLGSAENHVDVVLSENASTGFFVQNLDGRLQVYDTRVGAAMPTAAPFPFERWVCVELQLHYDAPGLSISIDGVAAFDAPTFPGLGSAGYSIEVGVAYVSSNQSGGSTVYADDVVVSTQPIGCE
jgi:hypothetical protein